MPSSMIFASLVVLWLLILVPAVARRRQEVARPSVAALSGRVLERPRQRHRPAVGRELEVDVNDDADDRPGWADQTDGGQVWERPPPRYRPGRGGFDPEAAALAARARYAVRQRIVLTMLIIALVTGVVAAVAVPGMWWAHAAVDVTLVGYLVYLRRQVRLEEAIRERRAARMAGTRRASAAEDPDLDEWARRGREATRRDPVEAEPDVDEYTEDTRDERDDLLEEEPERVQGTGEPVRRTGGLLDPVEGEPALPRLRPAPPPPVPAGTSLVETSEDDLELYDLDDSGNPDYRRAAGE
ncbi:hypothetical protein BJF78_19340 [Pseudonocardia sp. CNS-139]|nr:hypothetical protein BJF78_19340 [Pseudonocardia sp. CNS-139]